MEFSIGIIPRSAAPVVTASNTSSNVAQGTRSTPGYISWQAASEFAEVVLGVVAGRPPALDLGRERALHGFLHEAAAADLLAAAHDCGDGGLAVTLAEQAILGGHGFAVTIPGDLPRHVALFSESASRVVVAIAPERLDALTELAVAHGVPFAAIGETGGPRVVVDRAFETTLDDLRDVYEGAIPRLLGERT
jgi:phosphoribosylformylglycinamidine synthase